MSFYHVKIGDKKFKADKYSVTTSDLDGPNTKRTESGRLIRDRIRADVYKVDLGFDRITTDKLEELLQAISPVAFEVEFYDPTSPTKYRAKTMYASAEKKREIVKRLSEDETYWSFSVSLIEY